MELGLVIGHHADWPVGVKIPGHLGEGEAELGDLLHGELKQGGVVRLEVDLAAQLEHSAVELQEIPVGQAALGVALAGPRIAEVDIDAVYLAGLKEGGELVGVGVHEKDVFQPLRGAALHGHHHRVRHHLHRDEQNVRLALGGLRREAALAAAQLHPQLPGLGHQIPPVAPVLIGVPDQLRGAALHSGDQILLLSHSHNGQIPPIIKTNYFNIFSAACKCGKNPKKRGPETSLRQF